MSFVASAQAHRAAPSHVQDSSRTALSEVCVSRLCIMMMAIHLLLLLCLAICTCVHSTLSIVIAYRHLCVDCCPRQVIVAVQKDTLQQCHRLVSVRINQADPNPPSLNPRPDPGPDPALTPSACV